MIIKPVPFPLKLCVGMVLAYPRHKLMSIAHPFQAVPMSILCVVQMVLASTALLGRLAKPSVRVQRRAILMVVAPHIAVRMVPADINAPCIRAVLRPLLLCALQRLSIVLPRIVLPLAQALKRSA
jgi:hypothetical protein